MSHNSVHVFYEIYKVCPQNYCVLDIDKSKILVDIVDIILDFSHPNQKVKNQICQGTILGDIQPTILSNIVILRLLILQKLHFRI